MAAQASLPSPWFLLLLFPAVPCPLPLLLDILLSLQFPLPLPASPDPAARLVTTAAAMDAIKKKMVALREETDRAVAKANAAEKAADDANQRAEDMEEKQRKFQKKLSEKENRYEVMCEDLILAEIKAEEKEKLFQAGQPPAHSLEYPNQAVPSLSLQGTVPTSSTNL